MFSGMSTDSRTRRRALRLDPVIGALALLTAVSGVGDAISYLGLGHVFVANMTGNVVFLGFAAAGAAELSVAASFVALGGFLLGSLEGGRLARRFGADRSRWLRRALVVEVVAVAVATVIASAAADTDHIRYVLTGVLAFAMGVQNATVRALAVPDLTTTVLTLTLTGLAADSSAAGGDNPRWPRRTGAVVLMLAGAFAGGALFLEAGARAALALMLALIAAAIASTRAPHSAPPIASYSRTAA
jgi:uncharacterized membrane protein YoaK (UPF0700 family)